MSIKLIGVEGKSKRLLQGMLDNIQTQGNYVVCWGTSGGGLNGGERQNAYVQNKMMSRVTLVPDTTVQFAEAIGWIRDGFNVWGRNFNHTCGRDIVSQVSRRWGGKDYWIKVINDVKREWRIHVFLDKSIARGLKVQRGPSRTSLPIRNRRNGWKMTHDVAPSSEVREAAKKAVLAVGYKFGAVDLLETTNGQVYVLEVNRAPGLDNYTAGAYAEAIERWARQVEVQ
jgi:hypothetical protein